MANSVLKSATRTSAFPVTTTLGLAGLAAASTALPDWVPDWRKRWPLQAAIIGAAAAVFALRPEEVAPGTRAPEATLTASGTEGEPTTAAPTDDEHDRPSPVQGLDQPDIPWSKVLLPGVVLLAAGAAGGLWLERQAIGFIARRGVTRPRTVLAALSLPLAWWSLRQDLTVADERD